MKLARAGIAGLLIAVVAIPVARADVRVRAEGPNGTLVDKTVPRTGPAVSKAGATCDGDSGAGALDRAVGSANWDADSFPGADPLFVKRLFDVTLAFGSGNDRYWAFAVNNTFASSGLCGYRPQDNDELLLFAACGGPGSTDCYSDSEPVLDIAAPGQVGSGRRFTVTVSAGGAPAAGVTVLGGDQPATTGADGTAPVTLTGVRTTALRAQKGKQVPDETAVDVVDYAVATPTPTATPTPDTTPPVSRILGLRDGAVLRRGPRILRALVTENTGLRKVTLGIARRVGRRCTAYSDTLARFTRVRCGLVPRFSLGTARKVSLLLPTRLRAGVYTLDVRAKDLAGNTEAKVRGRNRVVFRVK